MEQLPLETIDYLAKSKSGPILLVMSAISFGFVLLYFV